MKIAILIASVRAARNSPRVGNYFREYIRQHQMADVDYIDLAEYGFPVFEERLRFMKEPPQAAKEFSARIKNADGVLIITPEYNGGYPAALKNVTDLLYDEWKRKPVAICTVSSGPFGGSQVITSLQFSLWKIGALTVPAMFPVADVEKSFSENGEPADKAATDKRAERFLGEMLWYITATQRMKG